jgi:uncharacterized protein YggE
VKEIFSTPVATIIASVLSTFIIAAIFFKLAGPVPISVTQTSIEKQSTFDVTGEGSATVIPDVAEVTLGISTTKTTVTSAQEEVNQVINNITQVLKDNGVEEKNIKTENYSVRPEYDYRQNRRVTGYTVSTNLQVKITDFNKLNQAIDSAVGLGANQIGSLNFTLSDQTRQKTETEARQEAVKKAKIKAQSLAKAAGIKLGRIVNVQENITPSPGPLFRSMEITAPGAEPVEEPTQIEPGSTEVKLTITLSYETL